LQAALSLARTRPPAVRAACNSGSRPRR
jgi:hypothetical protein